MTTAGASASGEVPRDHPSDWLTSEWIANDLQVPLSTWYQWRSAGKGPKAIKVGKHVRVRRRDYEAWLATLAEATS
jgi:excisionase family DNA binding protein